VADSTGDARLNFEAVRSIASTEGERLSFTEVAAPEQLRELMSRRYDLFFDAMFGTGLTRAASGIFEEAIKLLNEQKSPVIAVDIPSGISSDSAELIGPAVRARLTVTFTAPKLGNLLPPACDYSGELVIASIGSPAELIESSGSQLNLVEREFVGQWLAASRRGPHAHKGDVGKVLIIAGSRGKTGAACLAAEAALRAGAGLVTIAAPESSQPLIAARVATECMTEPLPETESGAVRREAVDRALDLEAERDVIAIGPGLGSEEESTRAFVRVVAIKRQRPMVIDADGLNSLAPWAENLCGSPELPLILTPHPGEMARLVAKPIQEIIKNRIEVVREFASRHGLIVVLKTSRTLIAAPDGEVYINITGNAGMATGGSGDVLTGLIAGLLAQKIDDPLGATISAVYLHGLAGDLAAARIGARAMTASDITAQLREAFIAVGGQEELLADGLRPRAVRKP
jgi:NAD(P)H-hydrate epimerase